MIHALKAMGKYVQKNSSESMLTQIVENPNSNGKYKTVLIIVFTIENDEVVFDKIRVEEFTEEKLDKYAYVYGNPRGGDLTPTSKITDLKKTYVRIQRPLKKLAKKLNPENESENNILEIYNIFNEEEASEKIFIELEKIEYEDNAVLTIAFKNDKLNYVGDFKEFTKSLMDKYEKKFYSKKSYNKSERNSIGKNNVCYICSKKSEKTYGYVGTYSFYTLDKPVFTTGGFNRGDAWKNYPVCSECAHLLDLGKKYLEDNLSSRFSGINYFIIPKTIFSNYEEDNEELFEVMESLEEKKKMSLKDNVGTALTKAQNDLFEEMSEYQNYVNFNLMFYEEQNSAFRILLYIEDVLPSYIKEIFEAKKSVEKEKIFKNLNGKEGMFDLNFTFNLISDFFYVDVRGKQDFTKFFLEIINNIFTGTQVSYNLLINRFVVHLQDKFRNNKSTWFDNLKSIMILKFLYKLDLLDMKRKEENYMPDSNTEYKQEIVNFLEDHSDVLDSNLKKMVFLEGVLAKKLLNIQSQEKDGSSPFRARLNGLKLNEKIVRRLYTEIINKLEEYNKNYYVQLEETIADFILKSDFDKITNNELSFYFVTGMNQANKFKFEKKEEE